VYMFAMLVPVLSSLCKVLQLAAAPTDATPNLASHTGAVVKRSMSQLKQVCSLGLQHRSAKVVQTVVSSVQNLLQNPTCAALCPIVVPCLVVALTRRPPAMPALALEGAWTALAAVLAAGPAATVAGESGGVVGATTRMVLKLVVCILGAGGDMGAHAAGMAKCLMQVARVDQGGLKTAVAALPADNQQSIQQLLREQVYATSRGAASDTAGPSAAMTPAKIELKTTF